MARWVRLFVLAVRCRSDPSPLAEFTKFEHTRTVNRVGFGAPGGNWLVSAAHDGLAKLWVSLPPSAYSIERALTRHPTGPARHSSVTAICSDAWRSHPTFPVRSQVSCLMWHISCFMCRLHPNRTAEPFSLALLTDTGYLFNFDLRNAAKGHLSRIAAHTGAGLGLDWRVASDGSGASWLASGGVDGLVKVWDMNSPTPALLRTLNVARPVQDVVWRPGKPTELAVTTLAAVGGGVVRTGPTVRGGTPTSTFASVAMEDPGTGDVDLAESREGDFEIWDIRRESVPKFVVRGRDGAATGKFEGLGGWHVRLRLRPRYRLVLDGHLSYHSQDDIIGRSARRFVQPRVPSRRTAPPGGSLVGNRVTGLRSRRGTMGRSTLRRDVRQGCELIGSAWLTFTQTGALVG